MGLNQKETLLLNNFFSKILSNSNISPDPNSEIDFDINLSFKIIKMVSKIFKKEPNVIKIDKKDNSDFVVVGDIHGNLESLIYIFKSKGDPSTTQYLFLGDYIDRGTNSCEVIILLYTLKCLYPDNIHLIRGNHEFKDMTERYGFKDECLNRIKSKNNGKNFYNKILNSFKYLPICSILNDKIFCVHGGISPFIEDRDHFDYVNKVGLKLTSFDHIQTEFFWSDPSNSTLDYADNPKRQRLDFQIFGVNALKDFLKNNKFDCVIRSHEFCKNGFNWPFGENEKLLTIFSSLNYCQNSNKAAIALISNDSTIEVCQFD